MTPSNPDTTDTAKVPNQMEAESPTNGQPEGEMGRSSLKVALRTRTSHDLKLVRPLVGLIKALPLPALLITGNGKIMTVNQGARILMSDLDWSMSWRWERDLWRALRWPSVPFYHWNWKGTTLSVWDCPLKDGSFLPNLVVRYLMHHGQAATQQDAPPNQEVSIGEALGRIVHEIKNPLASLEWFATLLGREDQDPRERKDLSQHLVRAIRSLDDLVSNLLVYSKPIRADRRVFGISQFLNEVEWLALHPLREKKIPVHRHIESGLEHLCGDETLLKQALLNLVLNAIHASRTGSPIDIECHRTCQEHPTGVGTVRISIQDSGCGMTKDEIGKMSDPFFSKRKGGTGLGLSIVKLIIEAHQGCIEVRSEQGKGTTVSLVLPQ